MSILRTAARGIFTGFLGFAAMPALTLHAYAESAPLQIDPLAGTAGPAVPPLADEDEERDPADLPEIEQPAPVLGPQDPLDETYDGTASRFIDGRDRAVIYDPLREPPLSFRDDRTLAGKDADWRLRDDAAFEALGMRTGSFIFYPQLYSVLYVSDNVFATHNQRKSDKAAVIAPSLRVLSDWNNHELELFFTGERKIWETYDSENTTKFETRARGRLDITNRSSVESGVRHTQDIDGRGSNNLPDSAARPGIIHESEAYLQADHRFNRLGFRLRGGIQRDSYDDVELNSGASLDNSGRENDQKTLALRTAYEFSPRLEVFADWENNWRQFRRSRDTAGFLKNRDGWLAAGGAKIELSPTLKATGRIGYARSTPDEPAYDDIEGVVLDGELVWQPKSFITVTLSTRTRIDESTQPGVNGSLNQLYGVELKTDWTYHFSSTFRATRETRDYADASSAETETVFGVGADYAFSRSLLFDAGFRHTYFESSSNYRENEVHVGLKLRH